MSEPGLSYRILRNGAGWYWEILDPENGVIERGIADDRVSARADAFRAALDRLHTVPDPYRRTGRKCPDTFSI
jgi:hypothetical protein